MKLNIVTISLLFSQLVLSGCALQSEFILNVDSIGDAKENKTYILLPGNKGTKVDDLQFKEYAIYVTRALQTKGFVQAETFQKANVSIFLGYGIGDPYEGGFSIPTWGETGVSSSTTTGTVSSYGSSASYSGTTTYTPTYGVTGSQTISITRYRKFMFLDAFDLDEDRRSKNRVNLWKTTVTNSGSSGDLRLVFPVLVAASIDYIGTTTRKKVRVKLLERDDQVQRIKGLLPEGDGLETLWYASGHKKAEVNFKNGQKDGLRTEWHKNGQKKSEGTYKNGKEDGRVTSWDENGQKETEGTYKDGELVK